MKNKITDYVAQSGNGITKICDAIEGLKKWEREFKEKTGIELDISDELKGIQSNLYDLIRMTEEAQRAQQGQ